MNRILPAKFWHSALILWAIVCLSTVANAQRQVIYADEIERAGILRPGEILLLANGWQPLTIDGLDWQARNTLSGWQTPRWKVLIDSQEVYISTLDMTHLFLLPIAIERIDSVEILSAPGEHAGYFSDSGIIHFHLRKPPRGAEWYSRGWWGNETGDPGPYFFTEYRTPNVDRIGPENAVQVSYARRNWSLEGSLLDRNHYSTDPAIFARHRFRGNQELWTRMGGSALAFRWQGGRFRQWLWLGHGTTADDWWSNLSGTSPVYFPFFQNEILAKNAFFQANWQSDVRLSGAHRIEAQTFHAARELGEHPNQPEQPNFDWREQSSGGRLFHDFRQNNLHILWGGEIRQLRGRMPKMPQNETQNIVAGLFAGEYSGQKRALKLAFSAASVENVFSGKAALSVRQTVAKNHEISANFAFSSVTPNENPGAWEWAFYGYWPPVLRDYKLIFRENGLKSRRLSFDSNWQWKPQKDWQVRAGVFWRQFSHRPFTGFSSQRQWITREQTSGKLFGGSISGNGALRNWLQTRWFGQYQHALGETDFRGLQAAIPNWQLRLQLHFLPENNFSAMIGAYYQSGSIWAGRFFSHESKAADTKLPGFWQLDASLQQRFWQRRVRGEIIFRNLLNRRVQYHPLGATFDLQVYLRLALALHFPRW